jgi:hypothetical protein
MRICLSSDTKERGIKRNSSDRRDMRLRLPPFNGLRLFEAAARCGSFKRAAQELNLTPGAVSHGINSLEEWLEVELFDRSREVVLTSAGRHYLPYIREAKAPAKPWPMVSTRAMCPSRRRVEKQLLTGTAGCRASGAIVDGQHRA